MEFPVSVDEFLEIEETQRRQARLRAPAREVRRFHAAARRFATAWCTDARRRIAVHTAKGGVSLQFEVEDRYGWVPVLCLRAAHPKGEFLLRGPGAEKPRKTSLKLKKALDQIQKAWRALPGAEPGTERIVTVHLPKLADSGFDRFLESALEACQGLD